MAPVRHFYQLVDEIQRHSSWPATVYVSVALGALKDLRDNGPMSRRDLTRRLKKDGVVDAKTLEGLLRRFELARPETGRDGEWKLID